ncbi:hypothetical protein ACFSKN_04730 [Mariniflexile gromovii]|uniref:Uncharacterized protein n=1 Tax=Mariniflexile gromovii TaxID=362523 RepID=A0ABS4BW74_9FLAO|nr:hypothetical protein [Mariniflexile gromovii]MBP0904847.1 hypothetical protein [Mariniflexile gromovii]
MITINTVNDKYFTLNSIQYARIYQPLKQGNTAIGIYNINDTKQQLLSGTAYDEFIIDGATYDTQEDTIEALLNVIFDFVIPSSVSTQFSEIESNIDNINSLKLNKGSYNGTAQDLKNSIDSINFEGVKTYQTLTGLTSSIGATVNDSAIVANDSTATNNGYYGFTESGWIKNSDLYENEVLSDSISKGVTGSAVANYTEKELLKNNNIPLKENILENYFPLANILGGTEEISNNPYSEGTAIKVLSGSAGNPAYCFSINEFQPNILSEGETVVLEFVIESNNEINLTNFTSGLRAIKEDTTFVTIAATKVVKLSSNRISFLFERVVDVLDYTYSAFYQLITDGGIFDSDTTIKTVSAFFYKKDEGSVQFRTTKDVILKTVSEEGDLKPNLFYKKGSMIAYGDSQTEGFNFSGNAYTSGSYLLEEYKWIYLFANSYNKNLSYLNRAVGGSRISWAGNNPSRLSHEEQSHFNKMGNLLPNWSGIVVTMLGWNNIGHTYTDETEKAAFFEVMKSAQMACIARLLIDDYGGVAFVGWNSVSETGAHSWSTNGANGNEDSAIATLTSEFVPFRYTDVSSLSARYYTKLNDGNFCQFTLSNKRACGLFFETSINGGEFEVLVNGTVYGTYTSQFTGANGYSDDYYPFVIWVENLPPNAIIRVNQISTGTKVVRFLAFGFVEKDSINLKNKTLLIGSVCGNNYSRNSETIYKMWLGTKEAVGCFSEYKDSLKFVDVARNWVGYTDQEPNDLSHLTPTGNIHVAEAFDKNAKNPELSYSNKMIKL